MEILLLVTILMLFLADSICVDAVSLTQFAQLTVISPQRPKNLSVDGAIALFGSSIPEEGLIGSVVGSKPLNGCLPVGGNLTTSRKPLDAALFSHDLILLVQRGGCNFSEKISRAAADGYRAVIIFDKSYDQLGLLDPTGDNDNASEAISIPAVFIGFLDGRLLWRKFQYSTGSRVVITSKNASLASLDNTTSNFAIASVDHASEIANVLLGFIPAVSYVCVVLLALLIFLTRRFFHCSLFVVYKMAYTHQPRVAPMLCSKVANDLESNQRCAICLEDFTPLDQIHAVLPCQHVYHQVCIDHWLRKGKLACPLCRRRITLRRILHHVILTHQAHRPKKTAVFAITSQNVTGDELLRTVKARPDVVVTNVSQPNPS